MNKQELKDEYLTELHKLLKVLIGRFHQKNNGEHEFVNSLLVAPCDRECGTAGHDEIDEAIEASIAFNDDIAEASGVLFYGLSLTSDFEVEYTFKLFSNDIGDVDLTYKASEEAVTLNEFFSNQFDSLNESELQTLIQNVKSQSTFGLLKKS
ncbi:hypothetical protein [Ferrovum sp. PN-J185]|uniref:hypothetical protein n=1 Tax=Ferrovum sp. PN-J185 TaxID=1356306 RepID=UPI0007938724|nr:hypothetical protein [Ferrovum sp. PN-J185]KXW55400.1 hypothetical protein FV185_16470 [Ferrovum sp. PN-J185]